MDDADTDDADNGHLQMYRHPVLHNGRLIKTFLKIYKIKKYSKNQNFHSKDFIDFLDFIYFLNETENDSCFILSIQRKQEEKPMIMDNKDKEKDEGLFLLAVIEMQSQYYHNLPNGIVHPIISRPRIESETTTSGSCC